MMQSDPRYPYIQQRTQGIGRSALYDGLALLSWVVAFGLAGYVPRKLPSAAKRYVGPAGYLLPALAFGGISLSFSAAHPTGRR